MAWYYYDKNDKKIGPIGNNELKQLVLNRTIKWETMLENDDGNSGPAGRWNLPFPDPIQTSYFYFDKHGAKYGPVNIQRLQELALKKVITRDTPMETNAGRKGTAGQIPGINFPYDFHPLDLEGNSEQIDTPIARLIESKLRLCSFFDNHPGRFTAYQRSMSFALTWLVLAGCLANALFYVICSIKSDTLSLMWLAGGLALVGVVLHFLCSRFAYAGTYLVAATPCRMSTSGLTESLGLFSLLIALAGLFGGGGLGIRMENTTTLMGGVAVFVSFGFITLCLLNPHTTLNLQFSGESDASAGETALSLWYVLLRLFLLAVPTGVALLALGGTLVSCWACLKLLGASSDNPFGTFAVVAQGSMATGWLLSAGVYPLLMYVIYLLLSLLAELCRAIFDIARNTQN